MNNYIKNILYTIIIFQLLTFSCISSWPHPTVKNNSENHSPQIHPNITELTIQSTNLSEDMSSISSKNDEIQIFIYDYSDTNHLGPTIYKQAILFDSIHSNFTFSDVIQKPYPSQGILFLMEEDSGRGLLETDSLLRKNFKEIIPLWNNHELVKLEKYLGDDDILGYKIIPRFNLDSIINIPINGILRADRYSYFIQLK